MLLAMPVLLAAGASIDCARPEGAVAALWWIGPREIRQGASEQLNPGWTWFPGSFGAIPQACITDLTSSAPDHVHIAKDGRSVSVDADAPAGQIVTLKGRIGTEIIKADIRVVGITEGPLAGLRRQTAIACEGGQEPKDSVNELKFTAAGEFAVTWAPFEAYRDYWGTYVYDAATHRLTLTVTGGNRIPAQLDLEGDARLLPDGSLELSGLWLGQSEPSAIRACAYTFAK